MKKYVSQYHKRPEMIERPKCEAKPHAMPWITKAMLTGMRAPVARVKVG